MKIKTYQDWLTESKRSITDLVLERIEPTIIGLLKTASTAYQDKFKREMTAWELKLTRLEITYDLLRSVESYLKPTDELVNISSTSSIKGSVKIVAEIQRDGQLYSLTTDVIYAGGYNVQRLHYRYITKTALPRLRETPEADEVKREIKRLTRGERIKADIDRQYARIKEKEDQLKLANEKTPKEIEAEILGSPEAEFLKMTWADVVARGADKNYANEKEFSEEQLAYRKTLFDNWRKKHIDWPLRDIEAAKREISSLTKKLDAIAK